MVAHTRTGDKQALKRLIFNEKLVGKGLNTDVILKKLKALHTELADMDQELVDVSTLNAVRKELISTSIMLHKDRGVKAYAACCLADILRLYAPDAPYTHTELRDIFQFFFRQLSTGLKGSDSSYYNEYFHLLESLSTVKSVVLVCDLPHAEELMVDIFRDFFGLVRRDLAKKIEMFMADILVALIDECQALPSDVLESIMSQFIDKNARMDQPAYRLAVTVCNATSDKLQRHVCQYFTDIIVSHSRDEEFDEIRTAHDLVKQLSCSCPALLHSVIPQLEEELRVDEVQLRLIATQVLGEMFSDKGGADLVKKYPSTWNMWLQRKNDKVGSVRLKLIEAAKGLLVNLPQCREVVEETLLLKLFDPDEKIRAAVCKVYSHLDYEMALHHATEAQLRAVAGRGLDKKHNVRVEALNSIGKLYSLAYPEIESGDPAAIQQFAWIPDEILRVAAISSEVRAISEQVLNDFILPLPSSSTPSTSKSIEVDEISWTDRLLNIMKFLDDKTTKLLFSMAGIKSNRPTMFDHFITYCEQYNGGIIDENEEVITQRLNTIIQRLSASFPDSQKAAEDLHSFAKANEGRLYKLFKICLDPQTDLKNLVKTTNDFLRRIEQSLPAILPTLSVLLRRASLRIVNQSSVPTLLKRVQKGDTSERQSSAHNAKTILTYISKHCPALYKPHVGELAKAIADEKNNVLVEVSLQALAAVAKWDNKLVPSDKRTTERVMRYVSESNPRHTKFAARLLAFSNKRDEICTTIVESISDQLQDDDPEQLVAHIAVLAQFAKLVPDAFENKSDVIMAFLLKEVIMKPSPPDANAMQDDEEWAEGDAVSATLRAKILSLKVCRNRSLAHASSDNALEISKPVLKLFTTLLENSGSFAADTTDDPKFKSRLRLQAAISLLHLSTIDAYANATAADFIWLAIMVQDPCFQVRIGFLTKLLSLLTPRKLAPRFNVIPFLTVLDPEAEVKNSAVAYISYTARNLPPAIKVEYLETIFIRFLHLLAHHPDFALSHDQLSDISKYINFYLDLVTTSENISLLYHLAMKAKTVRDSESHTYSENLYAMSELAQELIKSRAQSNSWSLQSYPGKVKLPSDILRALPSPDAANKILKTVYLPEGTLSWLTELKTKTGTAVKEKRRAEPKELKERKASTKRKAMAKTNGSTKRSRPAKKWDSEESDDNDQLSESGSTDADAATGAEKSESSGDDNENRVSALGRGARTRAKARIRKQAGFKSKSKSNPPSSDV